MLRIPDSRKDEPLPGVSSDRIIAYSFQKCTEYESKAAARKEIGKGISLGAR